MHQKKNWPCWLKWLAPLQNHEKISIQELEQDCARLRSQIVQSPERMRKNIEDLGTSVHAEKSLFQETQQQFRDLQIKTDMAKKAKKVSSFSGVVFGLALAVASHLVGV